MLMLYHEAREDQSKPTSFPDRPISVSDAAAGLPLAGLFRATHRTTSSDSTHLDLSIEHIGLQRARNLTASWTNFIAGVLQALTGPLGAHCMYSLTYFFSSERLT